MFGFVIPSVLIVAGLSSAGPVRYFPLKEGNEWVLRGPNELLMTLRVTGASKVGSTECVVVETKTGDQITREHLAAAADGIRSYRSEAAGKTIDLNPSLLRMKLPYQEGQTWQTAFTHEGGEYTAEFRTTGSETVTVPAGTFECVRVVSTITGPPGRIVTTIWYGANVGPVRQDISVGELNLRFDLIRTNVGGSAVQSSASGPAAGRYCPKCKADRPGAAKFCSECGTATVTKPVPPAEPVCAKCGQRYKAGAKFCSQCGSPLGTSSASVDEKPKPAPAMKRYESADGKLLLFHPEGWKVEQGTAAGEGSYTVTVASADQTATMMFATLPLGEQVTDSAVMAQIFLGNLAQAGWKVDVSRMTSAKDRARTRVETNLTAADGGEMKAHMHFFHTPQAGTVYCLISRRDKWEASLPVLTQIVANLAYSPEGVKKVQQKGRELAGNDRRVADGGQRVLSPVAMLAAAEGRQGRQLPLVQMTAPDQSFTIQVPQDWQFQGLVLQYWTSPDWQRKTHGVTFVSKEMISPRATSIRVPGVIMSDYLPPPQALALLIGDAQLGKDVQIVAETPAAEIVKEVADYLRLLEGRGTRGDIRLMHVKFTNLPTGRTCRGLFSVSCFAGSFGVAWSCLVEGGWAPDEEFEDYLPLYWRIVKSHRYNEQFVGQVMAQQAARQRQLNASLQRALAESRQAFQDLQGSFRENSRVRDYSAWLFSQTTLGQGSWVSQAEGGVVHQTDSWGIQRSGGDRVDLPEYNTTNFTGRSPWSGEQLQEINTYPEWQRYIQGQH